MIIITIFTIIIIIAILLIFIGVEYQLGLRPIFCSSTVADVIFLSSYSFILL